MCLAAPARITKIEGERGWVEVGGVVREANLQLLPEAKVRDYVLLHAGFAIQKLDEEEAEKTLRILREIAEIGN
ncbi:HypC/HybG/HupF family hydrogenase formation chaperone [bacterium]|nr:HypC/HybG/HupF family hydrogenase formation chaperone [bacterium]MCK4325464.1 HypC/HybG/HupF family hydrogenase formation chaperone [bacterium]MCK4436371.1 HypC/HybG/HupF family hydrogenase formation chaperone [bacterium]